MKQEPEVIPGTQASARRQPVLLRHPFFLLALVGLVALSSAGLAGLRPGEFGSEPAFFLVAFLSFPFWGVHLLLILITGLEGGLLLSFASVLIVLAISLLADLFWGWTLSRRERQRAKEAEEVKEKEKVGEGEAGKGAGGVS